MKKKPFSPLFTLLLLVPLLAAGAPACSSGHDTVTDGAADATPDETAGEGLDAETASDAPDADAAADDARGEPDAHPTTCPEKSYIWIANSGEGTLSKLCTVNGKELARYTTSPQASAGDPSRTSVNLHGDMVVTNRDPQPGPSSVTKFAAEKPGCVDRDGDGTIETSTGPTDVKPWGEDECMVWNTPLPDASATMSIGARATAWDGTENPETGEGGFVWIGALATKKVYKLDGATGELLATAAVEIAPYGGAVDGRGSFWLVAMGCTIGLCKIARLNMHTLASAAYQVPCGYGISVDARGRVWTAGLGCVNRFDPSTETSETVRLGSQFNRGIAVDNNGSVWAAVTDGRVVQVNEDTMAVVNNFTIGASEVVGVAIDFEGFVWAVAQGSNQAVKIDPSTYETEAFPVGSQPYTYSDMTGFQLSTVIFI